MSKMNREEKVAKIAYEAYCRSTGGKSLVTGDTLPIWEDLPVDICVAWIESSQAVVKSVKRNDQA